MGKRRIVIVNGDDENYWHTVEDYISRHTTTLFTHGICPTCLATVGR